MAVPKWLVKEIPNYHDFARTSHTVSSVETVCRHAACPNIMECFSRGCVTFLILGKNCTRNCKFCAVNHFTPLTVDSMEPERVAETVHKLNLSHAVVTSVSRDDLEDGGSKQFFLTIKAIRETTNASIEVLIPDFMGSFADLKRVVEAKPDVLAHNLETVQRLQLMIRPEADYRRSLELLRRVKEIDPKMLTKSGLILGMGEEDFEIEEALKDLRDAGCDILTLGQYRQPGIKQIPVHRFILEKGFKYWEEFAYNKNYKRVFSGTYVRSSYRSGEIKDLLKTKK
ncbi:lipoyl synthase [Candidatus Contubernalis alkaliaceticus]|uniref:lipoyl synthase n=1 Tax=Candidatus Contubernalis alkaliaceticus TaxID=338645 RepID=UPI001F4C1E38|nr:lipoyl synthase [Candidatus Contubernalis alkalaceticus]